MQRPVQFCKIGWKLNNVKLDTHLLISVYGNKIVRWNAIYIQAAFRINLIENRWIFREEIISHRNRLQVDVRDKLIVDLKRFNKFAL